MRFLRLICGREEGEVAMYQNECVVLILFVNDIQTAARRIALLYVKFCVAATDFEVVHDENLTRNANIVLVISNPSVGHSA